METNSCFSDKHHLDTEVVLAPKNTGGVATTTTIVRLVILSIILLGSLCFVIEHPEYFPGFVVIVKALAPGLL